MSDLYKFDDVYSTQNVKFKSHPKVIHETPRGLRKFKVNQKIKRAAIKMIDKA